MSSINTSVTTTPINNTSQVEFQQEQQQREQVRQAEAQREPQIQSVQPSEDARDIVEVENTPVVQAASETESTPQAPEPETFTSSGSVSSAQYGDLSVRA